MGWLRAELGGPYAVFFSDRLARSTQRPLDGIRLRARTRCLVRRPEQRDVRVSARPVGVGRGLRNVDQSDPIAASVVVADGSRRAGDGIRFWTRSDGRF